MSTSASPRSESADRPRVVGLTWENNGCAFYRVWMPFAALRAKGWSAEALPLEALDDDLLAASNVLVLPCLGGSSAQLTRLAEAARRLHTKLVYEADDDLWDVPDSNPYHATLREQAPSMAELLRLCDAATTTNAHLAGRIKEVAGRDLPVYVLPNHVDPRVWKNMTSLRRIKGLTVGVHGGATHAADWAVLAEAWPMVAEAFPEVVFVAAGFCPPALQEAMAPYGERFRALPWVPLEQYPALVAEIDVACLPLPDTRFNRSKSEIKLLESSMVRAASVVSDTVYGGFVRPGEALVIPPGQDADPVVWADAICWLLAHPVARFVMAKAAREAVRARREIRAGAALWEAAYAAIAVGSRRRRSEPAPAPRPAPVRPAVRQATDGRARVGAPPR